MKNFIIGIIIGLLAIPAYSQNPVERQIQCSDAGSNDTYACSAPVAPAAYVTGQHYRFMANTANTGAATINFNSLGAKTIVKVAGGITTTLADNDIRVGQWVDLVYDGTNMQMQSTLGNAAAGGGTITPVVFPNGAITGTGLTAPPGSANVAVYIAQTTSVPLSVSKIALMHAGFGYIALSIMDSSCSILGQTNSDNVGTNAVEFTVTGGPITIPAGVYYLGWSSSTTNESIYGAASSTYTPGNYNAGATPYYFTGSNASTGTTTVTMPSTCGTRTAVTGNVSTPAFGLY